MPTAPDGAPSSSVMSLSATTTSARTGASLALATLIVSVTAVLVPPSPSVTMNRTVRAVSEGSCDTLSNVMLRASAWAEAGVALALNVITSGVEPSVPPANEPMTIGPAPKSYVTSVPDKETLPEPAPWSLIASRSLAVPFAVKSTVRFPVSKSAESVSVTVAVASMIEATSPSVYDTAAPGSVTTGSASVTLMETVTVLPSVMPSLTLYVKVSVPVNATAGV